MKIVQPLLKYWLNHSFTYELTKKKNLKKKINKNGYKVMTNQYMEILVVSGKVVKT